MSNPAIPESPTARLLLELATQRASCEVPLGERTLILVEGALVDLRGAPDDCSLPAFLAAAGRIEEHERQAVEARMRDLGLTVEQALAELEDLEPDALLETRRALLLDRLVRALAALEDADHRAPVAPLPLRTAARGHAFDLVSLVLDALARRAAFGAAEVVGELRRARFVWVEAPAQKRAAGWAELGDIPHAMSIATLFPRHPAAPSRIAALVRAGVARLDAGGASSAPAKVSSVRPLPARPSTVVVAASEPPSSERVVAGLPSELPNVPTLAPQADSLSPAAARPPAEEPPAPPSSVPEMSPRPMSLAPTPTDPQELVFSRVEPDAGPAPASSPHGPLQIVPVQSWLPRASATLADPLLPLEAALAQLEPEQKAERAAAWLALASAWREQQQSTLEATRAAREAAAASPDDPLALATAAVLASATGAPEMAYAYARAWASAEPSDAKEHARALSAAAEYARRAGRPLEQREALRGAVEAAPDDATLRLQLARALARNEEVQPAVEHARRAAELLRGEHPERARAVLSWAAELAPSNLRTWNDLAKNLVRSGKSPVGVAALAHAARLQADSAIRERLRLSAVAFAELATQRESAIELLLESVDGGSALSEPLLAHLHATGDWITLAVLAEQLATRARGAERAALLVDAAEARMQLHDGTDKATELLTQALCADPESAPVYDAMVSFTREHDRAQALADALERAVDAWDGPAEPALEVERKGKLGLLLTRLRELPTESTTAPLLQRTAERTARLTGSPMDDATVHSLAEHRERFEAAAQRLERELRAANPGERAPPALRLAALCRQDPARRATARKLYEKVLEREPSHAEAQRGLEALLRLEGDELALDELFEQRSRQDDRAATQLALAYRRQRAGQLDEALAACETALSRLAIARHPEPDTRREALILQWRLAVAKKQPAKLMAALQALADAAESTEARTTALMRLSRVQRSSGDRAGAVHTAELALSIDPSCADAAFALMHDVIDLALAPKIAVLRTLRAVLGDTPELLRQLARACFAEADARGQREALEALARLVPDDGFAARSLVALLSTGRDPEALRAAIERALEPLRFSKQTPHVVQQGLVRLGALRGLEEPVTIVLRASEQLGEQARPLLVWAGEVGGQLSSLALRAELLEQLVAHAAPEQRSVVLQQLATLRREQGMLWAAARTELRLLALSPSDTAALERLAALYAETGELERLDAALALLLERASSETERRTRLFDRAVCLARFGEDADGAAKLIEQAFAHDERDGRDPPLEALRQGVGLLLAEAPERAFGLLLGLAQRATAERARDLIEEAMFLAEQRLARPDLALSAASQGALRQPQHEPFVATLERLGRASGQPELLVATLEEAAERCDLLPRQAELLVRAARLSEHELDDAVRASVLLDRAYRASPTAEIEEQLLTTAENLFARDVRAGKLAYDRLRDTLHVRAKFGAPLARAQALMTLARLSLEVYLNRDDALGYVEAARGALQHDAPDAEQAAALAQLELLAARLQQPQLSVRPLSRAPDRSRKSLVTELDAPLLGLVHTAPTFRPAAGSLTPIALTPIARIMPPGEAAAPLISIAPFELRAHGGMPSISVEGLGQARASLPALDLDQLVAALAAGETAALAQLAELLQREPAHAPRICSELLAQARAGSFQVCALRALRLASAAAHEHALWRTSSQALAFIEPPLRPPPSSRRRETRSAAWELSLAAARATTQGPQLALLAQLVESAAPLFRKSVTSVAGVSKEPEPLREAPYAPLLHDLAVTFGERHDAYHARTGEDRVALVSVLPAHLIIGDRTPADTGSLRFRLARAFELARSENILLATLGAASANNLLGAVSAAFANSTPAHVSRDAAALAADLWRTMPSKAQRTLAQALKALPSPLSYPELLAATQLRSARVGLFITRELDVALAQLGLDGEPSDLRIERSEGALNRALQEKPLLRALMSYAFSDAYLNAGVEEG
jgi:hypothetical protein